ncbi:MAG TPA: hypothetical protein VIY86_05585, partial [Pirellulaceae bacterium]
TSAIACHARFTSNFLFPRRYQERFRALIRTYRTNSRRQIRDVCIIYWGRSQPLRDMLARPPRAQSAAQSLGATGT